MVIGMGMEWNGVVLIAVLTSSPGQAHAALVTQLLSFALLPGACRPPLNLTNQARTNSTTTIFLCGWKAFTDRCSIRINPM